MSVTYEHAPLIELIAELKWNTAQGALFDQAVPGIPIQISEDMLSSSEVFFGKFAKQVEGLGFRNSERLFPIGQGGPPGQAAVRYRKSAGDPPLMQIGTGVFTANGLPPTYTHWDDFSPLLQDGVDALLKSRDDSENALPFTSLSLRYIDAFGPEYWENSSPAVFIAKTLGFGNRIPSSLGQKVDKTRVASAAHQLNIPLTGGSTMVINVGEGVANGSPAVILDVTVFSQRAKSETADVMKLFNEAHSLIGDMFLQMTRDVRHIMKPVSV